MMPNYCRVPNPAGKYTVNHRNINYLAWPIATTITYNITHMNGFANKIKALNL